MTGWVNRLDIKCIILPWNSLVKKWKFSPFFYVGEINLGTYIIPLYNWGQSGGKADVLLAELQLLHCDWSAQTVAYITLHKRVRRHVWLVRDFVGGLSRDCFCSQPDTIAWYCFVGCVPTAYAGPRWPSCNHGEPFSRWRQFWGWQMATSAPASEVLDKEYKEPDIYG